MSIFTHSDNQTGKQAIIQMHMQIVRQTDRETELQTERQTYKDRVINRSDRVTVTKPERKTDRQKNIIAQLGLSLRSRVRVGHHRAAFLTNINVSSDMISPRRFSKET